MGTDRISLELNGQPVQLPAEAGDTLLEVLRRNHLYGARESCGQGVCGTCTVLVNHKTVAGCIFFARLADGSTVETVEGLGTPGDLGIVQQAFIEESGFQCGFCTPGMIVSTTQLLRDNPNPTDDEITHYLAGNLCRCGAYPEIMRSVRRAAADLRAASQSTSG
ncbi:MAG: 2Fe-2S iron-sulfur cluster binding domain-containing protein [Acidimicrobiia bacterium]|nr:2Fe-2S iron-sulfur cluster binding domain-containing protein [Acidimicrobiia bacterium]